MSNCTQYTGLCGNFNDIMTDDFLALSGLVEGTAVAFANSWKAKSCPDITLNLEDPCSQSLTKGMMKLRFCQPQRGVPTTSQWISSPFCIFKLRSTLRGPLVPQIDRSKGSVFQLSLCCQPRKIQSSTSVNTDVTINTCLFELHTHNETYLLPELCVWQLQLWE